MVDQFPVAAGSTPDRRGQGTMVEQSRAATEVQAQVYLAREFPRDTVMAEKRMLDACRRIELAEAAFYSYEKGGKTVSDLTVHAACEIALIWGNIGFGLAELRRDDEYGQSEMLAYAWELESNARISSTFIVPHLRSAGGKRLNDPRDVYEINTNQGNRRMRAAILKVLPRWYVDSARRALRDTLRRSVEQSKKPLAQQIREAADWFNGKFGIDLGQLEHWAGREVGRWDADQLVQLRTLGHTLTRGEIRVDEAFPQAKVTEAEITGSAVAAPAGRDIHVHGEDPISWDQNCVHCQDQAKQAGLPLPGAEYGPALMGRLEAEMRAAQSASDLEDVYARAVEHRDAGNLTVDEFTQVEVAGSQRDRELAGGREADREVSGDA